MTGKKGGRKLRCIGDSEVGVERRACKETAGRLSIQPHTLWSTDPSYLLLPLPRFKVTDKTVTIRDMHSHLLVTIYMFGLSLKPKDVVSLTPPHSENARMESVLNTELYFKYFQF
jgi:hypothetical protein